MKRPAVHPDLFSFAAYKRKAEQENERGNELLRAHFNMMRPAKMPSHWFNKPGRANRPNGQTKTWKEK